MAKREPSYRVIFNKAAKEFIGSGLTILSIFLLRKLVEWLLGSDKLWDIVPVKYAMDTVDAAVIVRFVWQVVKTFND
jgi:hypothetical protein